VARAGPRKVRAYSVEFKLTAVRLSQQPGIQVQAYEDVFGLEPLGTFEHAVLYRLAPGYGGHTQVFGLFARGTHVSPQASTVDISRSRSTAMISNASGRGWKGWGLKSWLLITRGTGRRPRPRCGWVTASA